MKMHRIEAYVFDGEGYGAQEFVDMIANHRHISAVVEATGTVDIGPWTDDHPLNHAGALKAARGYFVEAK